MTENIDMKKTHITGIVRENLNSTKWYYTCLYEKKVSRKNILNDSIQFIVSFERTCTHTTYSSYNKCRKIQSNSFPYIETISKCLALTHISFVCQFYFHSPITHSPLFQRSIYFSYRRTITILSVLYSFDWCYSVTRMLSLFTYE